MAEIRTGDGRPLPSRLKAEIDRQCQRLALVDTMLKEIDQQRDAAVESKSAPSETVVRIQRLTHLKGIGPQIATVLGTEIFYREFANRRSLGSYLGLTPSPFKSGGMDRDLGISKAGNPRGRTTMIELAWLWLRYQKQTCSLVRATNQRSEGPRPAHRHRRRGS